MKANSKIVREKVYKHIMDFYEFESDLIEDVKACRHPKDTEHGMCARFVESGSLLVYTDDMREFLNSLDLNNNSGRTFTDYDVFKMYVHLTSREMEKILNKNSH